MMVALIAIGLSFWSYARLPVQVPRFWRYILGTLRAGAIWALLLLIIEPFLSYTVTQEDKPLIALVADNSESVLWGGALSLREYQEGINGLREQLESYGFRTVMYALDEGLRSWDSLTGRGQRSQLSRGIQQVLEAHPQTALLLLFSDGREWGESVPLPTEVPIWTVGVGPPTPSEDAAIEGIETPPWIGDNQPISIQVHLRPVSHPLALRISAGKNERRISIPPHTQKYTLSLPSLPVGFHVLKLFLEDPADPNPANNQRSTIIEVHPEKLSIFLWAGEITPDIAFFRSRLERLGSVQLIAARKPSGYTVNPETLRWRAHDIHILYNFPNRPEDEPWAERLLNENLFLLLSWGSLQPKASFAEQVGYPRQGLLTAYSVPKGPVLYLHTGGERASSAQPIDIGWGHPLGYKLYRGNKLTTVLTGEGWWQLRSTPLLEKQWDSLFFSLLQEGIRFQHSRWLFIPQRNPIAVGEAAVWLGTLPPHFTFMIDKKPVVLRTRPDGLQEAIWVADSAGLYFYTLLEGDQIRGQGTLLVEERSPELEIVGRDTVYLQYVARATGGRYFPWEQRDLLPDTLRHTLPASTFLTSHQISIPLNEWFPWLILILSLFSAEWVLRRYVGLY
ncbi:MAG: hypothetical protein NZ611_04835 [Bacteroidia bacterium]|nr:hypothetical protein [Bacteroidia bacterium]